MDIQCFTPLKYDCNGFGGNGSPLSASVGSILDFSNYQLDKFSIR